MNDDNSTHADWPEAPAAGGPAPGAPRSRLPIRRRAATAATLAGLAAGGMAGGLVISHAASASPSAAATPAGGSGYGYGATDGAGPHGGPGIAGGRDEDLQVAATAIGISVSDLRTALQNGQTIAAVARAHNVAPAAVIAALVASENKEVDDALAAERITQAQAAQMKAQQTQRVTDMVDGTMPRGGPRGGHGLLSEDASVVAGVIGISVTDLQTALQNGQTIAAVARAHGVDAARVISALVTSENAEIDARVKAGQITQLQASAMKQQTQQRVTDEVNGTFHPGAGHHGESGFGGAFGPGVPGGASGSA